MGGLFSRRSANSDQMDVRQNQDIAKAVSLVKFYDVTKLVIHPGVEIGANAFYGCTGLTSIVLPQGVEIGKGAFWCCTGLTSIVIHQGVKIGGYAFLHCTGLTSIVIHQEVTIGANAFLGCRGLTSIFIPQGVEIGLGAFYGCTGLTSIVIHPGVEIGLGAFYGCTGLTSIVIPQGVTIGRGAFERCTGLTSIALPQGAKIGMGAFQGCRGLTSIVIPQGVTIGVGAFSGCTGLTSIVIPQGVTIGLGAFWDCTGLTSIVIPQGVTIGEHAFYGCTNLRSIYVMCGRESDQMGWSARNQQHALGRTITFIQERVIEEIVNKVAIHLPQNFLTLSAFPANLLGVAGAPPVKANMTNRSPLSIYDPTSGLQYNNHLAAQQQLTREQIKSMRAHFMNLFMVQLRLKVKFDIPLEIWEAILSYLVYQNLGAGSLNMALKSLFTPEVLAKNKDGELSFLPLPAAAPAEPS